jgi:hypothetical protein
VMQLEKIIFFLFARGFQLDNGVTSPCLKPMSIHWRNWATSLHQP